MIGIPSFPGRASADTENEFVPCIEQGHVDICSRVDILNSSGANCEGFDGGLYVWFAT